MDTKTNILCTAWYNTYDFGYDGNGNATAHYELWSEGNKIRGTKTKREQIGYSDTKNGAAEFALKEWVKRHFKTQAFWIITDPEMHPWLFSSTHPDVPRTNRNGSNNTRYKLVLDCHPEEWHKTDEGIKRRIRGLVMELVERRAKLAKPEVYAAVEKFDTDAIGMLIGRFDSSQSTTTGLHIVDNLLLTAWNRALSNLN